MVMLEMVSEDFNCVRIMHVKYKPEPASELISLKRSGYNFCVELPPGSKEVEVSFSVLGGRALHKVDCTDPALPWIRNKEGKKEREIFNYQKNPPPHVRYFVCGPSWGAYISNMVEYQGTDLSEVPERQSSDTLPAVGGMEGVIALPAHMLPPEVLLYVPTAADIRRDNHRMIFLNTPLEADEQKLIQQFYTELKLEGKMLAHCSQIHILRLIQHSKGNVKKAIKQMECNLVGRQKFLVMDDESRNLLRRDLRKGILYMHGRDEKCRPCLVIRASRIDKECFHEPLRLCRVAVFLLEIIVRYGLNPGRVENWGVLIDLENAGEHGVPPLRLITSLVETLQNMYRFRMAWTKMVNAPWWFAALWSGIKRAIPGESVKKVEILSDNGEKTMQTLFNPQQLERKYGGTAPNLEKPDDFPYRFYPGPFSADPAAAQAEKEAMQAAVAAAAADPTTKSHEFDLTRLHEVTGVEAHEGRLWVTGDEASWLPFVKSNILCKSATEYLEQNFHTTVEPTETLPDLLRHLATRNHEFRTSLSYPSLLDAASPSRLQISDTRTSHTPSPCVEVAAVEVESYTTASRGPPPVTNDTTADFSHTETAEKASPGDVASSQQAKGAQQEKRLPVLLGKENGDLSSSMDTARRKDEQEPKGGVGKVGKVEELHGEPCQDPTTGCLGLFWLCQQGHGQQRRSQHSFPTTTTL